MAIKTALLDIREDDLQIGTTKLEAKRLASSMDMSETALMSALWNVILSRYNDASLKFVHCTCDLKLAAGLLESLHTFTDDYRNVRRGSRVVSASVSGSGGLGSDPGGVTRLTCNNLGQVIHSQLLRPTKPFTLPRSIN